jgi:hypothetical protein
MDLFDARLSTHPSAKRRKSRKCHFVEKEEKFTVNWICRRRFPTQSFPVCHFSTCPPRNRHNWRRIQETSLRRTASIEVSATVNVFKSLDLFDNGFKSCDTVKRFRLLTYVCGKPWRVPARAQYRSAPSCHPMRASRSWLMDYGKLSAAPRRAPGPKFIHRSFFITRRTSVPFRRRKYVLEGSPITSLDGRRRLVLTPNCVRPVDRPWITNLSLDCRTECAPGTALRPTRYAAETVSFDETLEFQNGRVKFAMDTQRKRTRPSVGCTTENSSSRRDRRNDGVSLIGFVWCEFFSAVGPDARDCCNRKPSGSTIGRICVQRRLSGLFVRWTAQSVFVGLLLAFFFFFFQQVRRDEIVR